MTRLRLAAVLLGVVGIVVGTATDTTRRRPPLRVDGFDVLAGDFHVHAFVGDGGLAPWSLQHHAARAGLDVIAITNHNQTLAGRIGRWAASRSDGPIVMPGEEVTGRNFHLVAVGIEQAVDWDQPVSAAIDQIHAQGGVAIAAHPMHGFAEGYDARALAGLDGLEAAHPDVLHSPLTPQFEEFYQRALAVNPGVAAIGSSDFHTNGPLGWCRTYLLVRERNAAGVVDAIRDGRTVGRCGDEAFRGRAELIRLLEPHRQELVPPADSVLSDAATGFVWVALVAFALLGPRPDPA
jgi:predicted metal-dependent phosphoesterase TrpH